MTLPISGQNDNQEEEKKIMPSLTYRVANGRIAGMIDGLEAMEQAIRKRLMTERYYYEIYDGTYGIQTVDLIGKEFTYVSAQLQQRIKETLLNDDRISDVYGFQVKRLRDAIWIGFNVVTIFGELPSQFNFNQGGQ